MNKIQACVVINVSTIKKFASTGNWCNMRDENKFCFGVKKYAKNPFLKWTILKCNSFLESWNNVEYKMGFQNQ